MADNVVVLRGGEHKQFVGSDKPLPDVIEACEKLLAMAKSGEVRSLAAVFVRGNHNPMQMTVCPQPEECMDWYPLMTGIDLMHHDLLGNMSEAFRSVEDDDDDDKEPDGVA